MIIASDDVLRSCVRKEVARGGSGDETDNQQWRKGGRWRGRGERSGKSARPREASFRPISRGTNVAEATDHHLLVAGPSR